MNAAMHIAALGRLYSPSPGELRENIAAGISRAADMARDLHHVEDCDAMAHQLTGLLRINSRLREKFHAASEVSE